MKAGHKRILSSRPTFCLGSATWVDDDVLGAGKGVTERKTAQIIRNISTLRLVSPLPPVYVSKTWESRGQLSMIAPLCAGYPRSHALIGR